MVYLFLFLLFNIPQPLVEQKTLIWTEDITKKFLKDNNLSPTITKTMELMSGKLVDNDKFLSGTVKDTFVLSPVLSMQHIVSTFIPYK